MRTFFLALLASASLAAIDYSPWFERVLYFEGRLEGEGQWGRRVDLYRLEGSLKVTPWTDIRAEVELDAFDSRKYNFTFEAAKASVQYRFLNDIVLDPVTMVFGLTGMIPSSQAKHERALYYPGSELLEAHLIIGKMFFQDRDPIDRWWFDLAYGVANERSPWWRTHLQGDMAVCPDGLLSLYLATLAGASNRAVELGVKYRHMVEWGSLTATLMRRPIAHRLPQVTSFSIAFETPLAF